MNCRSCSLSLSPASLLFVVTRDRWLNVFWNVLQCVAVCCSVLQCVYVCVALAYPVVWMCVAVYCSVCMFVLQNMRLALQFVLQYVCVALIRWYGRENRSVLQCVAVCCSVLRCVPVRCTYPVVRIIFLCVAECCRVLQSVAVCCGVLHLSHSMKEKLVLVPAAQIKAR